MTLIEENYMYEFGTNRCIKCYKKNKDKKFIKVGERAELKIFEKFNSNLKKIFKNKTYFELKIKGYEYKIVRTAWDYSLKFKDGESEYENIGFYVNLEGLVYILFRDIIGRSNNTYSKNEFVEQITKIYQYIVKKGVCS